MSARQQPRLITAGASARRVADAPRWTRRPGTGSRCSMAQADPFSRVALQAIAAEMADWLEAAELPTDGVRIAATPLSIWEVRSGASLEEAARNSGEWHHQILKEGGAFA